MEFIRLMQLVHLVQIPRNVRHNNEIKTALRRCFFVAKLKNQSPAPTLTDAVGRTCIDEQAVILKRQHKINKVLMILIQMKRTMIQNLCMKE